MTRKPKTDRDPISASILCRSQTPELEVQREQNKFCDDLKIALDRLNNLYTQKRLADGNQSQAAHQKQIERLLLLQESFVASFRNQLDALALKAMLASQTKRTVARYVRAPSQ